MALVAKLGLGTKMSQTKQQEQDGSLAKPRARRDWEPFWRIIAGLMLVVIAWVVWVLYQIAPRSVVTPLAYATQVRPIGTLQPAAAAPSAPTAPQPAPAATAADLAMDTAQAALRSGAHQAAADIQAAAPAKKQDQTVGAGLRLSTEISTPLAEQQGNPKPREADGAPAAPAATGAGAKDRP